jgi:hypothetical protein
VVLGWHELKVRPCLQNNQIKKGWRCGSQNKCKAMSSNAIPQKNLVIFMLFAFLFRQFTHRTSFLNGQETKEAIIKAVIFLLDKHLYAEHFHMRQWNSFLTPLMKTHYFTSFSP